MKTCSIHICIGCLEEHKKHELVNILQYFKKEDFDKFNQEIQNTYTSMEEEYNKYEEYLYKVETAIKALRDELTLKKKENEEITNFFISLSETYSKTEEFLNFCIRKNIFDNSFEKIEKERKALFEKKFYSQLEDFINIALCFSERKTDEVEEKKKE